MNFISNYYNCSSIGECLENVKRNIALWLLKSSEVHKIPESVINTVVTDVNDLFTFIMESLNSKVISTLLAASSINEAKQMIPQHFCQSYNLFQGFQTQATRISYFKNNLHLVVSYAYLA